MTTSLAFVIATLSAAVAAIVFAAWRVERKTNLTRKQLIEGLSTVIKEIKVSRDKALAREKALGEELSASQYHAKQLEAFILAAGIDANAFSQDAAGVMDKLFTSRALSLIAAVIRYHLSQTPWTDEHVEALNSSGVQTWLKELPGDTESDERKKQLLYALSLAQQLTKEAI